MKNFISISTVLLVILLFSGIGISQDLQTYQHPALNLSVQAEKDWIQVPHPEDEMVFEISDPESIVRVLMWATETESSGQHFLKKMAEKKSLVFDAEPVMGKIQNRDAWVLDATCCMKQAPVRVVLVAIPDVQENESLYIAQVLCPESRFEDKEKIMEDIIYSLEITN